MIHSKIKTTIRSRVKWKRFRKNLLKECDYTCELCGTKYSGKRRKMLNIHHLDESISNYDNLNKDNYKVLCASCHDLVEKILIKMDKDTLPEYIKYLWELLFLQANLLKFRNNGFNYLGYNKSNRYSIEHYARQRRKVNDLLEEIHTIFNNFKEN